MTSISKNMYNDELDNIVNKYNNTYHRRIKMKPADVKSSTYSNFYKENNKERPKLKVYDNLRISKYKNNFAEGYVSNWSEVAFLIKNVKNTVPWTYVISDLKDEENVETFYEKELHKTKQKGFRIEKVIKRKGNKLYVKWKGYDNSFNSGLIKKS